MSSPLRQLLMLCWFFGSFRREPWCPSLESWGISLSTSSRNIERGWSGISPWPLGRKKILRIAHPEQCIKFYTYEVEYPYSAIKVFPPLRWICWMKWIIPWVPLDVVDISLNKDYAAMDRYERAKKIKLPIALGAPVGQWHYFFGVPGEIIKAEWEHE